MNALKVGIHHTVDIVKHSLRKNKKREISPVTDKKEKKGTLVALEYLTPGGKKDGVSEGINNFYGTSPPGNVYATKKIKIKSRKNINVLWFSKSGEKFPYSSCFWGTCWPNLMCSVIER